MVFSLVIYQIVEVCIDFHLPSQCLLVVTPVVFIVLFVIFVALSIALTVRMMNTAGGVTWFNRVSRALGVISVAFNLVVVHRIPPRALLVTLFEETIGSFLCITGGTRRLESSFITLRLRLELCLQKQVWKGSILIQVQTPFSKVHLWFWNIFRRSDLTETGFLNLVILRVGVLNAERLKGGF